jgi:hypothetical protein
MINPLGFLDNPLFDATQYSTGVPYWAFGNHPSQIPPVTGMPTGSEILAADLPTMPTSMPDLPIEPAKESWSDVPDPYGGWDTDPSVPSPAPVEDRSMTTEEIDKIKSKKDWNRIINAVKGLGNSQGKGMTAPIVSPGRGASPLGALKGLPPEFVLPLLGLVGK